MKCAKCESDNKPSRVFSRGSNKTAFLYCPPFYDAEGKMHQHDENVATTTWQCTEGHNWLTKSVPECFCGWPKTGPFVHEKQVAKID